MMLCARVARGLMMLHVFLSLSLYTHLSRARVRTHPPLLQTDSLMHVSSEEPVHAR
jgi:hypothetical protein